MLNQIAQDISQRVTRDSRMQKGGVQIHSIPGLTSILANKKHTGPAQVSHRARYNIPGQGHSLRNLLDSAARIGGDAEEHTVLTRKEEPLGDWGGHNSFTILVFI